MYKVFSIAYILHSCSKVDKR